MEGVGGQQRGRGRGRPGLSGGQRTGAVLVGGVEGTWAVRRTPGWSPDRMLGHSHPIPGQAKPLEPADLAKLGQLPMRLCSSS